MATQRERLLAHYYDLEYGTYEDDLDFFVQLATALDPGRGLPLLELGCGTGRIALALAEEGFQVVGVDTSMAMLRVCAEREKQIRGSGTVTPTLAYMKKLDDVPAGPYNMAFCALNTFAHLISTDQQ